jgi:pimeloyl-ACP methyl ester carboxylesterase
MKLIGPVLYKTILVLFGLYVVFGALTQCASFSITEKKLKKEFKDAPLQPKLLTYEAQGRTIGYAQIGDINKPMIVFVHGSPGSWNAYIDYFKDTALTNYACLVSVDRPGYGSSGAGEAEPSMQLQAAMIAPILATSKASRKPVLVGHSLGGPIIARMAMDFPDTMSALVFLAPSIDPAMEKREYYRYFLKLGVVQAIMPPEMVASNLELMPLKGELDKMMPLWQNIRVPCTIMHGKKDMLVPYGNVPFYEKMLTNAPKKEVVAFENENHFIPWTQYDAVKRKLLEYVK